MRRVILESPYAGKTADEIAANVRYARAAVRDCILRGEAPFASHLIYTQPGILRDGNADERALGMKAGMSWLPGAEAVVVYTDRGITPGMKGGISRAKNLHLPVEIRTLDAGLLEPAPVVFRVAESPANLRDLLVSIGHDVDVLALANGASKETDVADAVRWARATHEARQHDDYAGGVPPCPKWLEPLLATDAPEPDGADKVFDGRDGWALAKARLEAVRGSEDDEGDEDPAEIARLPRHRVRRPDGKVTLACCAECRRPQYASPSGVVCTAGHGGAGSVPGCEHCGLVDEHRLDCPALERVRLPAPKPGEDPAPSLVVPPPRQDSASVSNPVLAAADLMNAEQEELRKLAASASPAPEADAPPLSEDATRKMLLERAVKEGLLTAEQLAEGQHSAWIRLQYCAPANWFPPPGRRETNGAAKRGESALPGERLDVLVNELARRGVHVTLPAVARWTVLRREVARAWIEQGGDPPEWLAHAPACAKGGCIGADAGCPAAKLAWNEPLEIPDRPIDPALDAAIVVETVDVGPQDIGELSLKSKGRAAKKDKRKPAAGPKPPAKDGWAAAKAAAAAAEIDDPEFEDGFFS